MALMIGAIGAILARRKASSMLIGGN